MVTTPFLLILCGLPSSGKTTFARALARVVENEGSAPAIVVSSDSLREMLGNSEKFDPAREKFVSDTLILTVGEAVKHGFFTIVDDLNYYESMRKRLKDIAMKNKIGYAIVHVDPASERVKEWNLKRGEPVPNSLIDDIRSRFDLPGKKYGWDKPIARIDTTTGEYEKLSAECYTLIKEKVRNLPAWLTKSKKQASTPQPIRELERTTRQLMGELLRRYKKADLVPAVTNIRKSIVQDALLRGTNLEQVKKEFQERVNDLLQRSTIPISAQRTLIHIGLFGHVDHGKTALAAKLTEVPSTCGLDKHPESRRRGMTLDIGFSAFTLGDYTVALVDVPGHYSLVKHAIGGASIVDLALLVVAGDEGVQVQTKEHLKIIESLGLKQLIVVVNKKDIATPAQISETMTQVKKLLADSGLSEPPIVPLSALTGDGVNNLKTTLISMVKPPIREWVGAFKMPVDHAFHVPGFGTVVTGTIVRGKARKGDEVEIQPLGHTFRIKLIQVFGHDTEEVSAGDRAALALSNLRVNEVRRGFVVAAPKNLESNIYADASIITDSGTSGLLKPGSTVSVACNLGLYQAQVSPFQWSESERILVDSLTPDTPTKCYIKFQTKVPIEKGDRILLYRADLESGSSRVLAGGTVDAVSTSPPIFFRLKRKRGRIIKKLAPRIYQVDGLFKTQEGAQKLLGSKVETTDGSTGIIKELYQKGPDVLVELDKETEAHEVFRQVRKRISLS